MVVASKRWNGAVEWLETAFRTISGVRASDWRALITSGPQDTPPGCKFCFMEPRHGHSPPCLRRSTMHVSSGVWEGFYASRTSSASLTLKCYGKPTRHRSLQFCATDVYGSSDMLPGQMRGWTFREHCAQLLQSYGVTGGVLTAEPASRRSPSTNILNHRHQFAYSICILSWRYISSPRYGGGFKFEVSSFKRYRDMEGVPKF